MTTAALLIVVKTGTNEIPINSSRVDTLWFFYTVESYLVRKELIIGTWNNMDEFYFERRERGTKEYGLYDCIYVKF